MGLFKKNENEVLYNGGQKHFIDVIKNTGAPDLLMWKQPEEDFNTKSKLIVMPGEQAIFVDGGNIAQVFDEGTYELNTNNYPFISRLKNSLSGGISTFNCVVYFFRKADSKEIRWGTSTPIQARDKIYGIRTSVKARGSYKVRIENPAIFLEKMIGSNIRYKEQAEISDYFGNEMTTKVRSTISAFINDYPNELIGLDSFLDQISDQVEPKVNETFSEYGLACVNFSVSAMDVDTSKYDDIDEAQVQSIKKMKEGQGESAYINQLGSNWEKLQAANIMNTMAANPGPGGFGAVGAGLGVGMAAGSAFGNMANQMFSPISNNTNSKSDAEIESTSSEEPMVVLQKLKQMLDAGLIEQSEYDTKKKEILARI